jgi:hypothetical protein
VPKISEKARAGLSESSKVPDAAQVPIISRSKSPIKPFTPPKKSEQPDEPMQVKELEKSPKKIEEEVKKPVINTPQPKKQATKAERTQSAKNKFIGDGPVILPTKAGNSVSNVSVKFGSLTVGGISSGVEEFSVAKSQEVPQQEQYSFLSLLSNVSINVPFAVSLWPFQGKLLVLSGQRS